MKLMLAFLALVAVSAEPAFRLDDFEMTSGELQPVTAASPAFASDSPVFRMRSKGAEYGDVEVAVELLDKGLKTGPSTEQNAWDGLHLWLRYQNPAHLYAVSVNRRDDRVVIKKKIPGGSSYGGSYFDLCETAALAVPYGEWQRVVASAVNLPDGSVKITLRVGGKTILEAVDDGSFGGPPIARPGRVGLRADNADFEFRRFAARPLAGAGASR